tara:strand:+ start:11799 stop:14423 length:2625 start_codon:yes stop_codon:yes gene_type:complete
MAKNLTSMNIVLGVVNTGLYKGLQAASARVAKFAGKMKAMGSQITSSFTMPFALIAGAGAKMAIDFEKTMTKISTLVLGSAKDLDKYAEGVKRISSVTAVSANETAEGLFFLTSAGLRGTNALETLMTVNKGVAIGLGEAGDLAKVAAAAQNAYGAEVITATGAVDAFGMAVRTGMFESKELAESLGTQVGMAAELGISFEELLANISTYTRTTGDARSATTGFGGVMMAITKPTEMGRAALDKINMSYDSLRAMVADSGLASTLFHLKDSFAANGVEMTELFGKSQAVKNIMGVLGEQGENYIQILDEMGDSADFTQEAFDELANTPGFKMEQAINNIKLTLQDIGDIVLPVMSDIVNGISNVIQKFKNLDSDTKNWALAIGGIIALSGPLMSFFGIILSGLSFLMSPIGMVIGIIGLLGVAIYKNWDTVKKWIVAITNYFIDIYNESMVFRGAIQLIIAVFKQLWLNAQFSFGVIYDVIVEFANSAGNILSGVGDIIKGIFTGSWDSVKSGWKKVTNSMGDGFDKAMKKITKRADEFGEDTAENWTSAVEKTLRDGNVEYVTEEDIQNGVDGMMAWAQGGLDKVKALFGGAAGDIDLNDLFGDAPVIPPTGGNGSSGGNGGNGGTGGGDDGMKDFKATLANQKSAMRTHLEGMGQGWKDYFAKQDADWLSWGQKTQEITLAVVEFLGATMGQLNAISQQRHQNEMIQMDNEYQQEMENLANRGLSEEEYNKAKEALDEKYADKKKELDRKAAKREKKMAIFNAIIGTAAAIAKALPNIPLSILAGVLGAAQISAISAQPIPMAKGALAFSPTNAIVGDNINAQNDPEVIAPLSKLQNMLGKQGQTVKVVGSISGGEIVLSSDKANIGLERYI